MDNNKNILNRMKIYANKYKIEKDNINIYEDKKDFDLADYIHINLHKMDYNEKILYYKKFLTENKINKKLLKYELYNYKPKNKINNFNNLILFIKKILNRYSILTQNSELEDVKWTLYLKNNKKYNLKENEAIFDNSIHDNNVNSIKVKNYIKQIINLISNSTDNFKISYKYLSDNQENLHWIIIKVFPKSK